MLRYLFAIVVLLHGVLHLLGFAKAFQLANITQLTQPISKSSGILWLVTCVMFAASSALLFVKKDSWWWILGIAAIVLSQILIVAVWKDAKWGTTANALVLIIAFLAFGSWRFEGIFRRDAAIGMERTKTIPTKIVTEADLQPLPELVQKYLRYVGVVGKPMVNNMKLVFDGQMRDKGKDWFPFRSEQYNFLDEPTRLFFMKAQMFGMTVPGYHAYHDATASMKIKLFGIFSIIHSEGDELNQTETVTLFNDWCLFAPARLIDERIQWEWSDSSSVKANFTNHGIRISAILYFNAEGQLINFVSEDRYAIADMQKYRFSTPVSGYKYVHGYNLPTYGEAIWHYPEGEFVYGKFNLKELAYNCDK